MRKLFPLAAAWGWWPVSVLLLLETILSSILFNAFGRSGVLSSVMAVLRNVAVEGKKSRYGMREESIKWPQRDRMGQEAKDYYDPYISCFSYYIKVHLPKAAPSLDFFPYVLHLHLLSIVTYRGHKMCSFLGPFHYFGGMISALEAKTEVQGFRGKSGIAFKPLKYCLKSIFLMLPWLNIQILNITFHNMSIFSR